MCDKAHVLIPIRARDGSTRFHAVIDPEDAPRVAHLPWYSSDGYVARQEGRTTIYMHRVILGLSPGDGIKTDHRDHNRTNNCRENLRSGTQAQNLQNTSGHRDALSPHRGVYYRKDNRRWRAEVQVGGVRHNLGSFATEGEAVAAAKEGRSRLMPWATE